MNWIQRVIVTRWDPNKQHYLYDGIGKSQQHLDPLFMHQKTGSVPFHDPCFFSNKQTNKQTKNHTNKQTKTSKLLSFCWLGSSKLIVPVPTNMKYLFQPAVLLNKAINKKPRGFFFKKKKTPAGETYFWNQWASRQSRSSPWSPGPHPTHHKKNTSGSLIEPPWQKAWEDTPQVIQAVTFLSSSWRSLSLWKGHLRSQRIARPRKTDRLVHFKKSTLHLTKEKIILKLNHQAMPLGSKNAHFPRCFRWSFCEKIQGKCWRCDMLRFERLIFEG